VIAIDLGARRIGVAVTDGLGLSAQPLATIPRRGGQRDMDALAAVVREQDAERVVLGLPLDPAGERGVAARSVERFAERLRVAVASRSSSSTRASAPWRRKRCCWPPTCRGRAGDKWWIGLPPRLFSVVG
jgi:RNase H-fold protein (predicted Holliday junction resolvase)